MCTSRQMVEDGSAHQGRDAHCVSRWETNNERRGASAGGERGG